MLPPLLRSEMDADMARYPGTLPGPTIVADWGDRLNITVINNLRDNG